MAIAKKTPLRSWETATEDGTSDIYIRLGLSLLDCSAFNALGKSSQLVYIRMMQRAKGKSTFTCPRSFYEKYFTPNTFDKAKKELLKIGFIEVVRDNKHTGKETLYKFSTRWRAYIPPLI